MTEYRLYFLDDANHIRGVTEFVSSDDRAATEEALARSDGRVMELWSRERFVSRFERRNETA